MSWPCIADLLAAEGEVALLGAPMEAGSVTPGRCDLAPGTIRRALKRFSTYDVTTNEPELDIRLADLGDIPVQGLMPADGFGPIRDSVAAAADRHPLSIVLGGNNAVTRPVVYALGPSLDGVGLITLDAHFDLRETDEGPRNGNPIRCLLEDGLSGGNIVQIGLAPFANTEKMYRDSDAAGISVSTIDDCLGMGIDGIVDAALDRLEHVDTIVVDFDIDVIDRSQCPGAPGARPGGMPATMFFRAARRLAAQPKVKIVDLTEFDPSLDVADITALTAGRWVCEVLAGYASRR
jgi:arginase family enzyme